MKIKGQDWLALLAALILPQAVGLLGSLVTTPNLGSWYDNLEKPFMSPPDWLFAPVWIILFLFMGFASFLAWKDGRDRGRAYKQAVASYAFQLFLNFYWSFLFFFSHAPSLAFFGLVSLWSMIIVNIYCFYQIRKEAAYLLLPYLLWVTFAGYLNYSIWLLNG